MRRFINSKLGKVVGNVVAMALFIPYVTFVTATRAVAQQVSLPSWAVLDFNDATSRAPKGIGGIAADAVRSELEKTQRYEPVPRETIDRAYIELDLLKPVVQKESLLRIGQEVKATTIVTGDIRNWRIVQDGAGKHAEVLVKIEVLDVASGIVVNGAALSARSTVRPMETADDTLLADALKTAAYQAVGSITKKELPHAAVLSTVGDTALINGGTRTGFKEGQEVIILRGREQVGSGVVSEIDQDEATIQVKVSYRGVQPGDKVRAIFTPPDMKDIFDKGGGVQVYKPRHPAGANSGLLTALAVVGVIVVVLAMGQGDQGVVAQVTTQASPNGPGGTAAIQISWTPDFITKGSNRRIEWDVWRTDLGLSFPNAAVTGNVLSVLSTNAGIPVSQADWTTAPTITNTGGIMCDFTSQTTATTVLSADGVVNGVPYTYSVSLIYRLMGIELPKPTSDEWCYFSSSNTSAIGTATPYDLPSLITPTDGDAIVGPVTFSFNACGSTLAPTVIDQYVVEISSSATFTKSQMLTLSTFQSNQVTGSTLTAGPFDLSGVYPASNIIYWRVGVRNIDDKPGPIPDIRTHERYIFSAIRSLHR